MKKIVFIGSVASSERALRILYEEHVYIALVCSLNREKANNVSDYYPLHKTANELGLPYLLFDNINEEKTVKAIQLIEPDYIFVVGLSQIVKEELLHSAKIFSVGFHPTPIPRYRGRAALSWQILLEERESAVTFFRLDQGMDSGDVLFRESYLIDKEDYVTDLYKKVLDAMEKGLRKNIHLLLDGTIVAEPQKEEDASYLLIRRPYDGILDWRKNTEELLRIIRATSHPYPGAFSYIKGKKIVFYRAERFKSSKKYIGYNGQVAEVDIDGNLIILTVDGAIKITEYKTEEPLQINIGNRMIGAYDSGIHTY